MLTSLGKFVIENFRINESIFEPMQSKRLPEIHQYRDIPNHDLPDKMDSATPRMLQVQFQFQRSIHPQRTRWTLLGSFSYNRNTPMYRIIVIQMRKRINKKGIFDRNRNYIQNSYKRSSIQVQEYKMDIHRVRARLKIIEMWISEIVQLKSNIILEKEIN